MSSRARTAAVVVAVVAVVCAGGALHYRSMVMPERTMAAAQKSFADGDYARAARYYERLMKISPTDWESSPQFRLDLAESYVRTSRDADAARQYEKYIALSGDRVGEATLALGMIYDRLGRSDDALPALERGIEMTGGDAEALLALGMQYAAHSDDERATSTFINYFKASPKSADALLDVGRYLMRRGMYRDALDGFMAASKLVASDDKRAYHAINAAKDMLGWPRDDEDVITPGQSIGSMRLRITRDEAEDAWGKPLYKVDEGGYSVWAYGGTADEPDTIVYFDEDSVIEIVTMSPAHATTYGLSVANFSHDKFRTRLTRVMDEGSGTMRYTLRGGGLAFYESKDPKRERPRAVIYNGAVPLTEDVDSVWTYYTD